MPIRPIGQPPTDRISDVAPPDGKTQQACFPTPNAAAQNSAQPDSSTPAKLAAQLVQDARTTGSNGNITAQLGNLVNAITGNLGLPELPPEQRQRLQTQLAEDPVVLGLIGKA